MKRPRMFCGWCGQNDHRRCPATSCACDTGHRPDPDLADALARYQRPDLDGGPLLDDRIARVHATAAAYHAAEVTR